MVDDNRLRNIQKCVRWMVSVICRRGDLNINVPAEANYFL